VAADNRLSFEQLAALAPGDPVMIEASGDFRRPRITTGTVVRIVGSRLVLSTRGARGGIHVENYLRRDGVRIGGGGRAELVNLDPATDSSGATGRRQTRVVDLAYLDWARHRGDFDRLRRLREAVDQCLEEATAGQHRAPPLW